jgi:hypothetical protein
VAATAPKPPYSFLLSVSFTNSSDPVMRPDGRLHHLIG